MSALEGLRKTMITGTGDGEFHSAGKVDFVADRDMDGGTLLPCPYYHPDQFALIHNWGDSPYPGSRFRGGTGEAIVCDSNARDPENEAQVACEAEPSRVCDSMAMKETDVG